MNRRTLLKMAGTSAVLAPGVAALIGGPSAQAAVRPDGTADAAASGRPAFGAPPILVGGAPVRPPSVPLAVRSPYLSTWLPATDLTAATPQFWYGGNTGFAGLVRIDGQVYSWAGQPEINAAPVAALTQTSLVVTATRSVFVLGAGGVELPAEWLSPIEPGDLRRKSMPFSLLNVSVRATDGKHH
jgi:Domain of unknown function (DUF5127)/Domain of unknown function (DUF4964)